MIVPVNLQQSFLLWFRGQLFLETNPKPTNQNLRPSSKKLRNDGSTLAPNNKPQTAKRASDFLVYDYDI